MKSIKLALLAVLSSAAVVACSDAQSYEVTGEVKSAQTVDSAVLLEFFELEEAAEGETAERVSIKETKLDALGAFTETIDVSPTSKVIVRAIADADADGKCSDGELWAEAEIAELKEDGTAGPVTLELEAGACPTDEAP